MASESENASGFERLLEAARAGDAADLGALLMQFRNYLLLVADRSLGDDLRGKVGPSDLVQETFLEAQRDFSQFVGQRPDELVAWLDRIQRNNLANVGRSYRGAEKRAVSRETGGTDGALAQTLAGDAATPSEIAVVDEQVQALNAALARLPEHYQKVMRLRYDEGMTFGQIGAAAIGCFRPRRRVNCGARRLWIISRKNCPTMKFDEPDEDGLSDELVWRMAHYDDGLARADDSSVAETPPLAPPLQERWVRLEGCLRLLRRAHGELPALGDENSPLSLSLVKHPVSFGRFRILAELGRGGFGVVYLADDPVLRRRVALQAAQGRRSSSTGSFAIAFSARRGRPARLITPMSWRFTKPEKLGRFAISRRPIAPAQTLPRGSRAERHFGASAALRRRTYGERRRGRRARARARHLASRSEAQQHSARKAAFQCGARRAR